MRLGAVVVLLVVAACGFRPSDRPPGDGGGDAMVDAAPPPPGDAASRAQAEVVAGAGRLHAGSITIDVEVGRAVPVSHATAGSITIDGQPVIKP